jgi:2-methylcitrate dehydratase PrpD
VVAAKLAAAGFIGPATVLEGPHGFLRAYSDAAEPDRLLEGLGAEPLRIMRVAVKPYACCRYVHGIIDGVLELRRRHAVRPRDVTGIDLGVLSIATGLVSDPITRKRHPQSVVDAQFSAPYAAAVALTRGKAGMDEFSVQNLQDPDIRRLMEATHCRTDPGLDRAFPGAMPATVRLTLTDGRQLETRVDYPVGEPENPLSGEAMLTRFIGLASPLLAPDEAGAFGNQILHPDGTQAIHAVMAALRTVPAMDRAAAEMRDHAWP